ncbi:hypothetical protein VZO05_08155 [Aggregatilineales bacterium SYSU G02658]
MRLDKLTFRLGGLMLAIALVMILPMVAHGQDATPSLDTAVETVAEAAASTAAAASNALDDLLTRISSAPQSDVARVLLIVGGVLLLVLGWRIYNYIIIVAGFLIGANIAASLVANEGTLIVTIALIVGGLIGAALAAVFYLAAVFLIGAYIGIVFTNAAAAALGLAPVSGLVLIVAAVLGGLVLIGLSFELLVVIAAVVGAQMLTLGLGLDSLWVLIFAAAGIVIQLVLMRTGRVSLRRRYRPRPFRLRI